MKFYTLEEMEDKYIGKVDTPERDQYEQELADELHAYYVGKAISAGWLSDSILTEQDERRGWKVTPFGVL